jgi:hypothetical protein
MRIAAGELHFNSLPFLRTRIDLRRLCREWKTQEASAESCRNLPFSSNVRSVWLPHETFSSNQSATDRNPDIDRSAFHWARVNCKLSSHQPHSFLDTPNTDSTLS